MIVMLALSVRGPWWWFMFYLPQEQRKDVENRSWWAPRELIGHDIQIHAAKGMTKREFDEGCAFALKCGATKLPQFDALHRGGIVGVVRLVRCVRSSPSPWFVGKFGFVLARPYPIPFVPCIGQTGFFDPLSAPKWGARRTDDLG